jgi:hypothetical protein
LKIGGINPSIFLRPFKKYILEKKGYLNDLFLFYLTKKGGAYALYALSPPSP